MCSQIFMEHPAAADMLLDILTDRGFSGSYIVNERIIPARIDPDTWQVVNDINYIHKFRCGAWTWTPGCNESQSGAHECS